MTPMQMPVMAPVPNVSFGGFIHPNPAVLVPAAQYQPGNAGLGCRRGSGHGSENTTSLPDQPPAQRRRLEDLPELENAVFDTPPQQRSPHGAGTALPLRVQPASGTTGAKRPFSHTANDNDLNTSMRVAEQDTPASQQRLTAEALAAVPDSSTAPLGRRSDMLSFNEDMQAATAKGVESDSVQTQSDGGVALDR